MSETCEIEFLLVCLTTVGESDVSAVWATMALSPSPAWLADNSGSGVSVEAGELGAAASGWIPSDTALTGLFLGRIALLL